MQYLNNISRIIQNGLLAIIMASSVVAWYYNFPLEWVHTGIFGIPVLWVVLVVASFIVADDVRFAFQKVFWFQKREEPLPIWQVGIGMLFYFAQVAIVEQFFRSLMAPELEGMPLYLIISFLNAFLLTVIFQEIFYEKPEHSVAMGEKKLK